MHQRIRANIFRQKQGLVVLAELLKEEFSYLTGRDPKAVTGCEFSIQELLKQLAAERYGLRELIETAAPGAQNVRGYIATLTEEQSENLAETMIQVDALEQDCAIQAEKNSHLAFALANQSREMLEYMHAKIQPQSKNTYASSGRYAQERPQAAIIRGRL